MFEGELTIQIDDEGLREQIDDIYYRLHRPYPLLKEIARQIRRAAAKRFADGGDPAWKPLAESTKIQKMLAELPALTAKGNVPRRLKQNGNFGAQNILIRSGKGRDSWVRVGAPGHVEVMDEAAGTVEVGSNLPYMAMHQEGRDTPYIIQRRVAKALSFVGGDGRRVFRQRVKHPGYPARPVTLTEDEMETIAETANQFYIDGKTI
jgi:phage gpG-like protein